MRRTIIAKRTTNQGGSPPVSLADMESYFSDGDMAKKEATPIPTQCRIHIHSKRKRLVDADGVSAKATIDGAVHGGLLSDDSAQYVEEVSYSQEKIDKDEAEETILRFYI